MIHLEKHTKTHENGNIEFNGLDIGVTHLPETGAVSFHECESWKETFSNTKDFIFHMERSHKEANVMFLG